MSPHNKEIADLTMVQDFDGERLMVNPASQFFIHTRRFELLQNGADERTVKEKWGFNPVLKSFAPPDLQ